MSQYQVVIVGAGIVGAATALALIKQMPEARILVLEKEAKPACHQTGRNSGVIHAGVYYAPGSLKAKYCREGLRKTIDYCQRYDLPYHQCGKLLVASSELELERMQSLFERCEINGLAPEMLSQRQLAEAEPNIVGVGAFKVADTGICNYVKITEHMLQQFAERGGEVAYGQAVTDIIESEQQVHIQCGGETYQTHFLVNCAGVYSDQLIKMAGIDTDFQIVPFRGEYYLLPPKYNNIVRHLIYPIPDPEMPFLGVHLTRMIDGTVTVGPNAVLAFGREAYKKYQFDLQDLSQMFSFPGTAPLLKRHLKAGLSEMQNSIFKTGYAKLVQKYCPKITADDFLPYRSGIRAQAVSTDGELLHDFKFVHSSRTLHVGNAPSPAATSAIPIAIAIVDRLMEQMH